jgi:hypothetical protein
MFPILINKIDFKNTNIKMITTLMSFQRELIKRIKAGIAQEVYDLWDTNSVMFNQDNVKTFLAFLSSEKETDVVKKYFKQIMAFFDRKVSESNPDDKHAWKYDIQTYSLIIRMYCMVCEYTIALEKFIELEAGIKDGTIKKAKKMTKKKDNDPSDSSQEDLLKSISTRVIRPFFEMLPESNPEILIGLFRRHYQFMKAYDYYNLLSKLLLYLHEPNLQKKDSDDSKTSQNSSDLTDFLRSETNLTKDLIMATVNYILKEFVNRQEIIPKSLLDLIQKWFPDHHLVKINIKKSLSDQCLFCGNCLKPKFLTSTERQMMVNQLMKAYPSTPRLNELKDWLMQDRRYMKPTFIIDGGNVGYHNKFTFSHWQINFMIRSLIEKYTSYFQSYYDTLELPQIIVIIHQRHLTFNLETDNLHKRSEKKFTPIEPEKMNQKADYHIKWMQKNASVYATPPKCNDDIFLLMASFLIERSITITNDQFRDHHDDKIDSTLFYRWRERHVASYNITRTSEHNGNLLEVKLPLPYSIGFQEIAGDNSQVTGWHIPVYKLSDDLQSELDNHPESFPDPKYFPDPVKNHIELVADPEDIEWYCLSKPI